MTTDPNTEDSTLEAAAREDPDTPSLDLATGAALIAEQRARVMAATDVDGRVLFGSWGTAWSVGFLLQWLAWPDNPRIGLPFGAALAVFTGLLVAAGAVTAVHLTRRSAGVRGTSAQQGAMYGWAWFLSFLGVGALGTWLGTHGAPDEIMSVAMTGTLTLLVGALYMAGGAMLNERTQFALGAWICLTSAAGLLAGPPALLLVIAVAGGGGMLLAGAVEHLRHVRRTRQGRA